MDPLVIVEDVAYVLSVGKVAVQVGADIYPFFDAAYNLVVNKVSLTEDQRAALATEEAALRAQLTADTIPADDP